MLVSLGWGAHVFLYVGHFVVANVVGAWYFTPHQREGVVSSSIKRAFTSSFGSLSFAALVIAVAEALKRSAQAAQEAARKGDAKAAVRIVACLCVCILSCVANIIEYLNSYAICMIALTGQGFVEAAKSTWKLFNDRGWSAVVNDDLVGPALMVASLVPAALSAAVGGSAAYVALSSSPLRVVLTAVSAVLCFIVGLAMASIMSGVVTSSVRTVFICFALNPLALQLNHPETFQAVSSAWALAHPAVWASCGYNRLGSQPAPASTPVFVSPVSVAKGGTYQI